MIQLKELKIMNDTTIVYLKKMGKSCRRNEIIKKILNDDACFFKMEKEDAYIILEDIGVGKDKLKEIYLKLTSSDIYYNLLKNKKIKENDEELKINYKVYDYNDIFKKKNSKMERNIGRDKLPKELKTENLFKKLIKNIRRILHIN